MTTGCIRLVCNMLFVVYVICPPSLRLVKYIWNTTCLVFLFWNCILDGPSGIICFWILMALSAPTKTIYQKNLSGLFVLFMCCLLIFSNLISFVLVLFFVIIAVRQNSSWILVQYLSYQQERGQISHKNVITMFILKPNIDIKLSKIKHKQGIDISIQNGFGER